MDFDCSPERLSGPGPISIAMAEVGAELTDQKVFRMLNEWGEPAFPPANSHSQVYELPKRRARAHPNVYSQKGIRLGPNASGGATNYLLDPKRMPPAFRKFSLREVPGLLRARGQFGSPHPCRPMHYRDFLAWATEARRWPSSIGRPPIIF